MVGIKIQRKLLFGEYMLFFISRGNFTFTQMTSQFVYSFSNNIFFSLGIHSYGDTLPKNVQFLEVFSDQNIFSSSLIILIQTSP